MALNKYYLVLFPLILLGSAKKVDAQGIHLNCPSDSLYHQKLINDPDVQHAHEILEKRSLEFSQKANPRVRRIIPVVVHIIHEGGVENIPDANVIDFIRVLNEDFQKRNADTAIVAPAFQGIIGNLDLEFRLASKDPNGNCTNGITRIYDPAFTNNGFLNYRPISWPRSMYLNVWVVKNIPGAGAFSNYPSSVVNFPVGDGVVCRYTQFGGLPPSGGNFSTRTMTHEIGHWLNLPHTWGSTNNPGLPSNCLSDDGVADTPLTIGVANQSCNLNDSSCGTLNNVNNYMDYSTCGRMFTAGQVSRMEAALTSNVSDRNNLFTSSNLLATGTDDNAFNNPIACPPVAEFAANPLTTCEGRPITFTSYAYNSNSDPNNWSYSWTFQNGTPASSTLRNPVVSFTGSGSHDVSLSVTNSEGSSPIAIKSDFIATIEGSGSFVAPYLESISNIDFPMNANDQSLSWEIIKPNNTPYAFERTTNAYYSFPSGLYLNNFDYAGSDFHELISPVMDLTALNSGAAYFNFQVAHARKGNEGEVLFLYSSKNCGQSWDLEKFWVGNNLNSRSPISTSFSPLDSSEWRFISHDISALAGLDNITFKLVFDANRGNNIYLDDISVSSSNTPTPFLVALDNYISSDATVYPNPNSGEMIINLRSSKMAARKIRLYDIYGKEIKISADEVPNSRQSQFVVKVIERAWSKGIYFLSIENEQINIIERIILE